MSKLVVMQGNEKVNPVAKGLSKSLANLHALYLLTQNCHWNITGIHFSALHTMLEDQYTELATAIDDTAERIKALDSYAPGSIKQYAGHLEIKEIHHQESTDIMLSYLVDGHTKVIDMLRRVLRDAESANDDGTVDFLGTRIASHEKILWMLKSSQGT